MQCNTLKMSRWILLFTFFFCLQVSGCQNKSKNDDTMPQGTVTKKLTPITLSNGRKVSDCEHYNTERSRHFVSETIKNSMIADEYLSCSLSNTSTIELKEASVVAALLMSARVRQIPLSIAQLFGRTTTLLKAGFIHKNNKLVWSAKHHNITVQVKAIDNVEGENKRYLVWVSDVISDGNYYAYYPAWVEIADETNTMKVFPVYSSGY